MRSPVQFLSHGSFHCNCFIFVKLDCILSMYVSPVKHINDAYLA